MKNYIVKAKNLVRENEKAKWEDGGKRMTFNVTERYVDSLYASLVDWNDYFRFDEMPTEKVEEAAKKSNECGNEEWILDLYEVNDANKEKYIETFDESINYAAYLWCKRKNLSEQLKAIIATVKECER